MYVNNYYNLTEKERKNLFYPSKKIKTPFAKINITYADYIASGQFTPIIENYMIKHIYPYYANTHSNASNGMYMKNLINNVKDKIRTNLNIDIKYKILFDGNGTTNGFNHLINLIDYAKYNEITIFISIYEHYSNHLLWVELSRSIDNLKLKIIPLTENETIDLKWLNNEINSIYHKSNDIGENDIDKNDKNKNDIDKNNKDKNNKDKNNKDKNNKDKNNKDENNIDKNDKNKNKKNLIICSLSACSNITGIIIPLDKIRKILNNYQPNKYFHSYFFADYACSAPYVKIDGSIFDAFVFSPHKFLGGMCCPGILIAKECLFNKAIPYIKGGGCVSKCNSKQIIYENDLEKKESAGTPNIIGIIKFGKVLDLKNYYQKIIDLNESIIEQIINEYIYKFTQYPNFKYVMNRVYQNNYYLPIFSFSLTNLHYNLIVVLLNDLFGIQSRGGIGCCGLLAEYIEKKYGFRGWCRISFHWSMSYNTIKNIFKAIEYIIINGEKYKNLYKYDQEQNLYKFSKL